MSIPQLSIKDYVQLKKHIGIDALLIIGLPGSGKSCMANNISECCLAEGENFILEGDRFCEWRHLLLSPHLSKVTLLLPHNYEVYYHDVPTDELIKATYGVDFTTKKVDLEKLDVMDYLTPESKGEALIIYDAHFQGLTLWKRARLWVNVVKQLLSRTYLLESCVGILFHEAGILWKQMSREKHWKAVNEFSELVVECRKGLVRLMFLSQLKTEMESTIREKCLWKIFRLGTASDKEPTQVQKAVPFQDIDEYTLMVGGFYYRNNKVGLRPEIREAWKIIPVKAISDKDSGSELSFEVGRRQTLSVLRKIIPPLLLEIDRGKVSLTRKAELIGISKSVLSKWLTNERKKINRELIENNHKEVTDYE